MKSLVLGLLTIIFALFLFGAWKVFSFFNYRSGTSVETVIVDVSPGRNFAGVTHELESLEMISSGLGFRVLGRLTGQDQKLRVGEYQLHRGMGPLEIMEVLSSGRSLFHTLTIPEGTNMYEIARLLEKKGLGSAEEYLKLFKDKVLIRNLLGTDLYSLEGYLFPETYNFTKYSEADVIVKAMVSTFLRVYSEVVAQNGSPQMSRHELVTLASVIEKETGAAKERPLISSVFHNRLKKSMRLQSDPTILYGILDETGLMKKNIKRADIDKHNRYNTYRIPALPFGPISNPGRESLAAAIRPADSLFLYFVSRNDGTHVFSESFKKHNAAVRKFQLDRRAREGKSWRDLKQ